MWIKSVGAVEDNSEHTVKGWGKLAPFQVELIIAFWITLAIGYGVGDWHDMSVLNKISRKHLLLCLNQFGKCFKFWSISF